MVVTGTDATIAFASDPCVADGEETVFKVKKTTKMKKIMDAYAQRVGQQVSLRL